MDANKSEVHTQVMRVIAFLYLLFSLIAFPGTARAHDPLEISATVYLHTNRLELRAIMVRQTILRIADHQAVPLLDFSIPAEREEAMPMLRSLAGSLFTLTCGTNVLRATEANVILGAEDHVGFNLTFPLPASAEDGPTNRFPLSTFRFPIFSLNARLLAHLPSEDPYGVNVIVLDVVNNKVREQKLLNAQTATMEIALTNQPNQLKVKN